MRGDPLPCRNGQRGRSERKQAEDGQSLRSPTDGFNGRSASPPRLHAFCLFSISPHGPPSPTIERRNLNELSSSGAFRGLRNDPAAPRLPSLDVPSTQRLGRSGSLHHVTGIAPQPSTDGDETRVWSQRWSLLGRPLEVPPTTPVAIALSGGADSVYLLTMIARSEPRPKALAIHVDHGLRGEESRTDAEFCARLCAKLGVPFARRMAELDPEAPDLEGRARKARYKALLEEASAGGFQVLLTGHHEDDAVETLLQRWMRGTEMQGLAGLRRETILGPGAFSANSQTPMRVLRPLMGMRREEVRSALRRMGIEWREDLSNASPEFSRNRVRGRVLPAIAEQCGEEGVDNLRAFARAVESFEDEIADRTAHISWEPVAHEAARRSASMPDLGGSLRRETLDDLSPTLVKRALGRLIGEGTGQRPTRRVVEELASDLADGRNGRREIHDGWTVQLQSSALHLTPPTQLLTGPSGGGGAAVAAASTQTQVAAPQAAQKPKAQIQTQPRAAATERAEKGLIDPALQTQAAAETTAPPERKEQHAAPLSGAGLALGVPGAVQLPDGRSIHASVVPSDAPLSSAETVVDIDADGMGSLTVRFAQPGDRFRGLGAPGHKPIRRFLNEMGIPREERDLVPLVIDKSSEEVLWVAGIRIADSRRVRPETGRRVRLSLEGVRER